MTIPNFPTHLGGELANLSWEDLNPHELALSAAGTTVKAAAIALLAYEQAEVAKGLGRKQDSTAYRDIADVLARTGRNESLSSTIYPTPRPRQQR